MKKKIHLKKRLSFNGQCAAEFLAQYPVRRPDLSYSFTHPITGVPHPDVRTYFEVGDGGIFCAYVLEEHNDMTLATGWGPEKFPSVSVDQIFASEDEALKRRDAIRQSYISGPSEASSHVLERITKNKPDYPAEVYEWGEQIAEHLEISAKTLDFSYESLLLIDRQLKVRGLKKPYFDQHLFGPLLGYVGEAVRRHVNGEWLMVQSKQDETIWEPVIVESDGSHLSWFLQFWDLVNEDYKHFSIETIFSLST